MTVDAHPAMNFKTGTWSENGISKNSIVTRRYLAGELVPNYFILKNVSFGLYYLYSHCFDKGTAANTHFSHDQQEYLKNIKLFNDIYFRFTPQFYYLNQDGKDGVYLTSAFTLSKNRNKRRESVSLWEMGQVETIEQFYKRKFDWVPAI